MIPSDSIRGELRSEKKRRLSSPFEISHIKSAVIFESEAVSSRILRREMDEQGSHGDWSRRELRSKL